MYFLCKEQKDDVGLLYINMDVTVTCLLLKLTDSFAVWFLIQKSVEFGVQQLL